jgi:hypothetical protein
MKKVIICGTRTFNNQTLFNYWMGILYPKHDIEIISGGAPGADRLGEIYANHNKLGLMVIPANWKKDGKAAGPIRNKGMALMADEVVAFWDGYSRGTMNMISIAKKAGLIVHVIKFT